MDTAGNAYDEVRARLTDVSRHPGFASNAGVLSYGDLADFSLDLAPDTVDAVFEVEPMAEFTFPLYCLDYGAQATLEVELVSAGVVIASATLALPRDTGGNFVEDDGDGIADAWEEREFAAAALVLPSGIDVIDFVVGAWDPDNYLASRSITFAAPAPIAGADWDAESPWVGPPGSAASFVPLGTSSPKVATEGMLGGPIAPAIFNLIFGQFSSRDAFLGVLPALPGAVGDGYPALAEYRGFVAMAAPWMPLASTMLADQGFAPASGSFHYRRLSPYAHELVAELDVMESDLLASIPVSVLATSTVTRTSTDGFNSTRNNLLELSATDLAVAVDLSDPFALAGRTIVDGSSGARWPLGALVTDTDTGSVVRTPAGDVQVLIGGDPRDATVPLTTFPLTMTIEPYIRPSDADLRSLVLAARGTLLDTGVTVIFLPDSLVAPLTALERLRDVDRATRLVFERNPALRPWDVHVVVNGAVTTGGLTSSDLGLVEVMVPVADSFASVDPLAAFGVTCFDLLQGALVHELGHVLGAYLEDVWRPAHVVLTNTSGEVRRVRLVNDGGRDFVLRIGAADELVSPLGEIATRTLSTVQDLVDAVNGAGAGIDAALDDPAYATRHVLAVTAAGVCPIDGIGVVPDGSPPPPSYCYEPGMPGVTNPSLLGDFDGLVFQSAGNAFAPFFDLQPTGTGSVLALGIGDARFAMFYTARVTDWVALGSSRFADTGAPADPARPSTDRAKMSFPFFPFVGER